MMALRQLDLTPYLRVDSPIPHDIRFQVEDPGDPNVRVQISAHRFLLSIISPVFQAQFYGSIRLGGDSVVVQDCDPWSFQRLVDFIYSSSAANFLLVEGDATQLVTIQKLFNLIKTADRFMISSLVNLCNSRIRSIPINEENVFVLAAAAENINHIDILSRDIFYKCGVFIRNSILFDATFARRVSEQDKQVFEHLAGMDILEAHLAIRHIGIGKQGDNSTAQITQQSEESIRTNEDYSNVIGNAAGKINELQSKFVKENGTRTNKIEREHNGDAQQGKIEGNSIENENINITGEHSSANIMDGGATKVTNGGISKGTNLKIIKNGVKTSTESTGQSVGDPKPANNDTPVSSTVDDASVIFSGESKDMSNNMTSDIKETSGSKDSYLHSNGDKQDANNSATAKTNAAFVSVAINKEGASVTADNMGDTNTSSIKNTCIVSDTKDASVNVDTEGNSVTGINSLTIGETKKAVKARRLVSCISDNQPILVENFAHYGTVKWKTLVRSSSTSPAGPAVEYGKMLRPPYHLMSLLRFMPGSAKGYSFTDKNTMIFVVLEGQLLITIHTTEMTAKRGDCFYVPTKNGYNIVNIGNITAELALVQYQYDGPLPQGELLG